MSSCEGSGVCDVIGPGGCLVVAGAGFRQPCWMPTRRLLTWRRAALRPWPRARCWSWQARAPGDAVSADRARECRAPASRLLRTNRARTILLRPDARVIGLDPA